MSSSILSKSGFAAGLLLLLIGIDSVALFIETSLTEQQWSNWTQTRQPLRESVSGMDDPASREWSYDTYLAAQSEANLAVGQCGFGALGQPQCGVKGYSAAVNWIGLVFLALGAFAFGRLRMTGQADAV
ncbi:hypothetical protein [Rhodospirillum sp. A1_3_36]|uniref:hypothetical protein n=1 Tax=Rhodospirillum sp. A1_3_36 TaxID=3391666 RepID=UPI0039A5F8BD